MVHLETGTIISLIADNGKFLGRVTRDGTERIEAEKNGIDIYGRFIVKALPDNKIALIADNGKFLSRVTRKGIERIEAIGGSIDVYQQFKVIELLNNKIALIADNGKFLSRITRNGINEIEAIGGSIDVYQQFIVVIKVDWEIEEAGTVIGAMEASTSKQIIAQNILDNPSTATIEKEVSESCSKVSSFEITLTETLCVSSSMEIQIGVPDNFLKTSLSVSLTLSAGQRWEKTEMDTYTVTDHVILGPYSSVLWRGILNWAEGAYVPITLECIVRGKFNGTDEQLNCSQLKEALMMEGFTGTIIEERDNELLVTIKCELRGSWGINTEMQIIPLVMIEDSHFLPTTKTIEVGNRVAWHNNDGYKHTVTSDIPDQFDSGEMSTGDNFLAVFDEIGDHGYHCKLHTKEKGVIKVIKIQPESSS